ncbi:MAG: hypothetical protein BA862_10955 [Desulfobulbaceae bacterium S3730MH12]|nr:MAG: hypothetical protein BA866_02220 [Desulfobulbaceae bacterium S5133MH15]OEU54812.1 MAG: hypothetical protein BA862_10955 [Desulfobulbaceae bacterium S3730MH12]OEU84192.1 MAG: hypothetical protein BA873_12250 [Desulfobulbaceae bacterium C00003063]
MILTVMKMMTKRKTNLGKKIKRPNLKRQQKKQAENFSRKHLEIPDASGHQSLLMEPSIISNALLAVAFSEIIINFQKR